MNIAHTVCYRTNEHYYTVNAEHLARPFKTMIMFFKRTNILQFSTVNVDSVEWLSEPSCLVPLTRVKLTRTTKRTTMYAHHGVCMCARCGCWFSIE